jgi:hypothetical protein
MSNPILYYTNNGGSGDNKWETLSNWNTSSDNSGSAATGVPWGSSRDYDAFDLADATAGAGITINSQIGNWGSGVVGNCDISNINNTSNAEITGGSFSGSNFFNYGHISGGTFSGYGFENYNRIDGGIFSQNGTFTPIPENGEFWNTDSGTIFGGTFTGNGVLNYGHIWGGTFTGDNMYNFYEIHDGNFTGNGFLNTWYSSPWSGIHGGTFSGNGFENYDSIIYGGTFNGDSVVIGSSGSVWGGTFSGNGLDNYGQIHTGNFTGGNGALMSYNYGTILDGNFGSNLVFDNSSVGTINGGIFSSDNIINNGTIKGGTFSGINFSNVSQFTNVISGGTFSGNGFRNYGNISNGTFTGTGFSNQLIGSITGGTFEITDFYYESGNISFSLIQITQDGTPYTGYWLHNIWADGVWQSPAAAPGALLFFNNGGQGDGTWANQSNWIDETGQAPTEIPWTGATSAQLNLFIYSTAPVPQLDGLLLGGSDFEITGECDSRIAIQIITNGYNILNTVLPNMLVNPFV